jgi:hypothetical protein
MKLIVWFLCIFLQADAGGSPSLIARGLTTAQAAAASEQIQIQVPNEKVISFFGLLVTNVYQLI